MSLPRLILLGIVSSLLTLIFIENNADPGDPIFWNLLAIHDKPAAWLMLGLLAIGYGYGFLDSENGAWAKLLLLNLDRQRYLIAAILWLGLCAGSLLVYHNHPLSMDEYAALFQARIFAAGALYGHFPVDLIDNLIPRPFQNYFLMVNRDTGAVFSSYWPGFSLLLAPFVWLDIPWACNPTLVVASFLLIGRVARDLIASPLAPGWALLFALASPAFVANGITYYSMSAHLLFNLGFAWLLLSPTPLRIFLAGLTGGFALALHNPFPHIVFAVPWILWLSAQRGERLRNVFYLAAGYLPMVLVLVIGWPLWKQDILLAGTHPDSVAKVASVAASTSPERLFAMLRGFLGVLHLPDGFIVFDRIGGLAKLWLWASPLLLLLAWWGGRGEKIPGLRLLGASALITFFAYFAVPFDQGHGWGYRYFHPVWAALPILAALGAIKLAEVENNSRVYRQVMLMALLSLVAANALRFEQMGSFMEAHLAQFPPRVEAERRIVMHNGKGYYAKDIIQNDPWLRGNEIVVLVENDADKEKILKHFPNALEASRNGYGITLVESERR